MVVFSLGDRSQQVSSRRIDFKSETWHLIVLNKLCGLSETTVFIGKYVHTLNIFVVDIV